MSEFEAKVGFLFARSVIAIVKIPLWLAEKYNHRQGNYRTSHELREIRRIANELRDFIKT